jgi:hypothetical protein
VTIDAAELPWISHNYFTYGVEIDPNYGECLGITGYASSPLDAPNQEFTAKERDTESNLDYFGARYFSGPRRYLVGMLPSVPTALAATS